MGNNTAIQWCDATFNPWTGCTKISPACDNCYARNLVEGRLQRSFDDRIRTAESTWKQPRTWNRKAERDGVRRKVFCASLADVFDNQVPEGWREDLFALIDATPWLDWLLLTKRPQNIAKMMPRFAVPVWNEGARDYGDEPAVRSNVWLGTTAEDNGRLWQRLPHLLSVPAAVHFLSCEPMLGRIDLPAADTYWHALDWVIAGNESGPNRRPGNLDHMRSLRDQCAAAGMAFFGKQDDGKRPLPDDLMVRQFPEVRHG